MFIYKTRIMLRHFFLICILMSGFTFAHSNDLSTTLQNVSLHLGLNQIKEENLHPKVHYGAISGLSYRRYNSSLNGSLLETGVFYSPVKTGFEDLTASVNGQLFFEYSRLFTVFSKQDQTLSIGPMAGFQYNVSFYPNWDESHLHWANHLNIGATSIMRYRLTDKTTLMTHLGFSLFSLTSRPEKDRQYKIDDLSFGGILNSLHSNIKPGTMHKVFNISLKPEIQFQLGEKHIKSVFYHFQYSRLDNSHAHLFQNSRHSAGLKFYFL